MMLPAIARMGDYGRLPLALLPLRHIPRTPAAPGPPFHAPTLDGRNLPRFSVCACAHALSFVLSCQWPASDPCEHREPGRQRCWRGRHPDGHHCRQDGARGLLLYHVWEMVKILLLHRSARSFFLFGFFSSPVCFGLGGAFGVPPGVKGAVGLLRIAWPFAAERSCKDANPTSLLTQMVSPPCSPFGAVPIVCDAMSPYTTSLPACPRPLNPRHAGANALPQVPVSRGFNRSLGYLSGAEVCRRKQPRLWLHSLPSDSLFPHHTHRGPGPSPVAGTGRHEGCWVSLGGRAAPTLRSLSPFCQL